MLHHIEIYVSDLNTSHAFWSNLLAKIGYEVSGKWDEGFTLSNEKDAYFTFVQVSKKYAAHKYHRCGVGLNHLAFKVENKSEVDAIRQHCLDNGIICLYDDKFPHANGGQDYYALFLEDPDRIKVEFVAA